MTKSDLINALKEEFHITRPEVTLIVNLFFDEMSNALANGDRIELRGFGAFSVKTYDAYTGRNPKTQQKVKTKSKKLPFFKPGKELKERVNVR